MWAVWIAMALLIIASLCLVYFVYHEIKLPLWFSWFYLLLLLYVVILGTDFK